MVYHDNKSHMVLVPQVHQGHDRHVIGIVQYQLVIWFQLHIQRDIVFVVAAAVAVVVVVVWLLLVVVVVVVTTLDGYY